MVWGKTTFCALFPPIAQPSAWVFTRFGAAEIWEHTEMGSCLRASPPQGTQGFKLRFCSGPAACCNQYSRDRRRFNCSQSKQRVPTLHPEEMLVNGSGGISSGLCRGGQSDESQLRDFFPFFGRKKSLHLYFFPLT